MKKSKLRRDYVERNRRSRSSSCSSDESSRPSKRRREHSKRKKSHHSSSKGPTSFQPSKNVQRSKDFSFEKYKYELNRVFCRDSDVIQDVDDLWMFVKKYENMRTKSLVRQPGQSSSNGHGSNEIFDKTLMINLTLTTKVEELEGRLPPHDEDYDDAPLTKADLLEFRSILLAYLDFKQKEKFSKLRKLREAQANLPVSNHRDEILEAVKRENVIIIAGDTGCGKSTQVPQYLMKAGYNRIACTQPRRIACISLSKRVAFETLSEYKNEVGYQIRFEKNRNQQTKIVFITEGLLLRQAAGEGQLADYDVIVLDEVHERHLHGDFLLGVVKCLLHQRTDVKVILMSATINIQLFSEYFGSDTCVIQVPGRLHPIKLHYRPIVVEDRASKSERLNPAPYVQIMHLIDEKYPKDERGDLLIFLSGMSEITAVVDAAKQYNEKTQGWIILPLHSTLSIADQDKVFDYPPEGVRKCIVSTNIAETSVTIDGMVFDYPPEGVRKCIVSTNIAETSVTIDGIRFVVDSGKVKEMSYDPVCKMQRLKEFWISRASAEQRKGRAGRTGPGVCYRLYSEEEYSAMSPYTTPEIQRVPLDSLLLQMISMGLPDARKFPFIEPPPADTIETAIFALKQHGALTGDERMTTVGRMLSRLPVDLPLGKMLIMGSLFHQVEPVLSLAAALSVQTPFTNRAYRDADCQAARRQLESDHGDPITLLNAFREWLEAKRGERGASRQWCRRRGLEEQRFYEMTKLRAQFKDLLQDCGLLKAIERPNASMSSAERSLRHGEVKLLKSMKRSLQEEAPRRRRTLKPDTWTLAEDEEEKSTVDIRDIDFRLSNDSSQLQNLLAGSSACSYKDLAMLKLILTSGLYPQLAVPDEFNHCKTVSEQLFHSQSKPFISLHPMSFFGNNSSVLQLDDADIVPGPGKHPLSHKHQLLCYMSLLETTKAYLVNTLRMPAAQTLLIFCHELHTNIDLTRIVCDSWLELKFPVAETAETLIRKVVQARSQWEKLLQLRFEDGDCDAVERSLTQQLVELMNSQIVYSVKRLLAADLKLLYVGPGYNMAEGVNPLCPDQKITVNEKLGGVYLAPYLTYNCLTDDMLLETWSCEHCGLVAVLNFLEKHQHLHGCQPSNLNTESKEEEELCAPKPNSMAYDCPDCVKTLYLTPIEILKHKRSHSY